jgi:MerR family transcriptional regulator, light-induced transcriptional regulator
MSGEESPPDAESSAFNTQAVERLTGVPADTFRAWERRYGVPSPRRLPGGRRAYSARDVEIVRWLRTQTENGLTASMAVAQLKQDPQVLSRPSGPLPESLSPADLARDVVQGALRFDTMAVEQAISRAIAAHPLDVVCLEVAGPALVELGEMWHRGEISPAVEHFATQLVRRRLDQLAAILDSGTSRPLVVVGSAPGELHDIAPLIFSILLRRRGVHVAFLGPDVPPDAALDVARRLRPEVLCLCATTTDSAEALIQVANAVQALPAPVPHLTYGGRAFDLAPSLVQRTPGIYLGTSMLEAVATTERLLRER